MYIPFFLPPSWQMKQDEEQMEKAVGKGQRHNSANIYICYYIFRLVHLEF